jgi:hypothetical protein
MPVSTALVWEHTFEETSISAPRQSRAQHPAGTYAGAVGTLSEPPLSGSYSRLSNLPAAHDPFSPENQQRLNHEAAARNGELSVAAELHRQRQVPPLPASGKSLR